ncbi:MAG: hypothetical protein IJW28_00450, partial [Clostridia bacterium]|nr:hypothetical protein [Clostridia bacterium]
MDFELNLTLDELVDRTSSERLRVIDLLGEDDKCYSTLSNNDKMVLCHLVRAGSFIENIHYRLENEDNLPFLDFLNKNTKDKSFALTKTLFLAQKNMIAVDMEGNTIKLAKGDFDRLGKGFYPKDLNKEEFCHIIELMLDKNMI